MDLVRLPTMYSLYRKGIIMGLSLEQKMYNLVKNAEGVPSRLLPVRKISDGTVCVRYISMDEAFNALDDDGSVLHNRNTVIRELRMHTQRRACSRYLVYGSTGVVGCIVIEVADSTKCQDGRKPLHINFVEDYRNQCNEEFVDAVEMFLNSLQGMYMGYDLPICFSYEWDCEELEDYIESDYITINGVAYVNCRNGRDIREARIVADRVSDAYLSMVYGREVFAVKRGDLSVLGISGGLSLHDVLCDPKKISILIEGLKSYRERNFDK